MIDANYPSLSRAIAHSQLWRMATGIARAWETAWQASFTAAMFSALAKLRQTRRIAIITAIAMLLSVAARRLVPVYVRPGLPVLWPLALIALLIVIAVWPSAFERAWGGSMLARMSRRG